MKVFWKRVVVAFPLTIVLGGYLIGSLSWRHQSPPIPNVENFETFFKQRLESSQRLGARPGNEEKLLRFAPRTAVSILYIHGFGASRAEGEHVVDRLARRLRLNTYYLRLPGHGTNPEDQASAGPDDYQQAAALALAATNRLGERTIIVATSMGALLAVDLAARYPDRVAGLVLASPFFGYAGKDARLMDGLPFPVLAARLVFGEKRGGRVELSPDDPRKPSYRDFWYTEQYTRALEGPVGLRRRLAEPGLFRRVRAPVLLLYYYRDEQHQDPTADVASMLDAFAMFGRASRPHGLSRTLAVENGSHVLLSEHVRADHVLIETEIMTFLKDVQNLRSQDSVKTF